MELIAFAIAFAVAYQALKGYKLSKERTLLYLHFSFILLGTGLLVDALASMIVVISHLLRGLLFLYSLGYTINFIAQLVAYGILIFLVVYITAQMAINYSINKSSNALLVFGAFASLALAHLFFLMFILIPVFFALAHIAQLFGFLLLLAMLLRVNQAS